MPSDATQVLQAAVTKTATFNGPWFDLGTGTPVHGLVARVEYSAASNGSGSNTVGFSLDESDDGSTVAGVAFAAASDKNLTLSTTAQAGEQFIPFITRHRYVRLTETMGGAGTSPTITYQAEIVPSMP